MSATMLDRSFPTTVGFGTITGFAVPSSASPPPVPTTFGFAQAASLRPQPLPALSVKLPATPPLHSSGSNVHDSAFSERSRMRDAGAPPTPTTADQLGWKGLLEISRNSGASGVLGVKKSMEDDTASKDAHIEICCTAHTNTSVRRLVKSVVRGLKACQDPEKALEGMGGTYFFLNENGRKAAILKPCDEEPLAPNNPKGYVGRSLGDPGWKPTVRVGEAAMREVAAYLLDHDGFAKVPTSVLVRARHPVFCYNSRMSSVRASSLDLAGHPDVAAAIAAATGAAAPGADGDGLDAAGLPLGGTDVLPMKLGSLQEFVYHECDTSEMGPSRFSAHDVHRIGILDIRLFNTDRHAGNMLVRVPRVAGESSANLRQPSLRMEQGQYELIPIDHGFCLPETLEAPYFEWLHWPQTMLPFTAEELEYIAKIDIEADKELLRKELPNLRPECLRLMELSTTLLKMGAEAGLTLFEIASVLTRPFEGCDEEPSELEKIAAYARGAVEAMSAQELEEECDDTIEEEGSDNDGEDDELLDSLDAQIDAHMATESVPGRKGSSREDESMVFDLDEEGAHGGLQHGASSAISSRGPNRDDSMAGADTIGNGSIASPGSSSLSSVEHISFGTPMASIMRTPPGGARQPSTISVMGGGAAARMARGLGALGMLATPIAAAAPNPAQMASSVHITDGFLWRRMKGRQVHSIKRHGHHKRPGTKLLASPQAYPPPVVAFSPESLTGLFSDTLMDERQWGRFMDIVASSVTQELKTGKWRQGQKDGGVAMSLPVGL